MKKVLFFIFLIVSVIIIKNFVISIYDMWKKQDLIIQVQKELEDEKKKNKTLKDQLSVVQSPSYLEEQARNKLFLVKPGEMEVVFPTPVTQASQAQKSENESPYWKQWLALFW